MKNAILILAIIIGFANCAPAKQDVTPYETVFDIFSRLCVTMLPEHGGNPREPEPFPVTIVRVPEGPYRVGQQVLVTLRGNPGFFFTGFLIQARVAGSTTPIGRWTAGATGTVVGCANPQPDFSGDDTAAHQAPLTRNVQELVWTATTAGNFRLELTTVERFGVYWMDQFSGPFTVTA
jgi:Reeler domain